MNLLLSDVCGKCLEDKQAWLKKSPILESFDKDELFDFIFLEIKAILIMKNSI